ncbi:MAG: tRNA pseudouridine(55) synthase TruB [Xanthomonadales bacterium]|nr:tRNA pseudouridine(55) synthase TruB [Xanthomonadales bacterium]
MSRRRNGKDIHGIVLLDKPAGYSSNQAVQAVKRLLGARKAGHTGSLDPFATGMLPICLGEASKTAGFMLEASKVYLATARMGQATTTGDIEGEVVREMPVPEWPAAGIETALERFHGPIEQVPPMYSALKHEGRPLYKLAREGKEVPRQARAVIIHSLELIGWDRPLLTLKVECSKGTYIRTLAEDIAAALGNCAHLQSLRRLSVGPFHDAPMVSLDELEKRVATGSLEGCLLAPDAAIADWPLVRLAADQAERFAHGNSVNVAVDAEAAPPGLARVYGPGGPEARLLGLGEVRAEGRLHPKRLMLLTRDDRPV